jgi:glycosyltransferase involved in cell wall biosynthesis
VYGGEKWRALVDSDLFCFPSHSEQFPITILEAMAVGLPVVATRVGAIEDAIVPGSGGWLVEPNSPEELARVLTSATEDVSTLKKFGSFNRQRFLQRFTSTAFGDQWECLLVDMLHKTA